MNKREMLIERNTTHGLSKNSAYSNWKDMKKRCFNPANKRYKDYAERGISVHPDFVVSFEKFLKEIGEKPDGNGWSIGRIDNNKWYTYGNIRWETPTQQARNHTLQVNNKTGVPGVCFRTKTISGKDYSTFIAYYIDLTGVKKTKNFSADKYGYDEAFTLAVSWRKSAIDELNKLGAGYAQSHGSQK